MTIHKLALAKQTGKGAAAASAQYAIPLVGGTVKPKREGDRLADISASRIAGPPYTKLIGVEGNPDYAVSLQLDAIGLLLYGLLGSQAITGSADPWDHEINEESGRPWFTFWRMFEDLSWEKFIDCRLSQGVLTSEKGSPLHLAMVVNGLEARSLSAVTFGTEVAVAEPVITPVMHYDGAGAFTVGGVVKSTTERIVTTINNNDSVEQGDNVRAYDVHPGVLDVGIETTSAVDAAAVEAYNLWHYGSATPPTGTTGTRNRTPLTGGIEFKWTAQDDDPGPERSLRIQVDPLDLEDLGGHEPAAGQAAPKQARTYRMLRPASGKAFTAHIKNAVAANY